MKFICDWCVQNGSAEDPCILNIKGAKHLDYDRPGWRRALRRCPFEDEEDNKLMGVSPLAEWVRK